MDVEAQRPRVVVALVPGELASAVAVGEPAAGSLADVVPRRHREPRVFVIFCEVAEQTAGGEVEGDGRERRVLVPPLDLAPRAAVALVDDAEPDAASRRGIADPRDELGEEADGREGREVGVGVAPGPEERGDVEVRVLEEALDRVHVGTRSVAAHEEHRKTSLLLVAAAVPPDGVGGVVLLGPPLGQGRFQRREAIAPLVAPRRAAVAGGQRGHGHEARRPRHCFHELVGTATSEEVHVVLVDVVGRARGHDAAELRQRGTSKGLREPQADDAAPGAADNVDAAVAPALRRGPDHGVGEVPDLRLRIFLGAVGARGIAEAAAVHSQTRQAVARQERPRHRVQLPRPVAAAVRQFLDQARRLLRLLRQPQPPGEARCGATSRRKARPRLADRHADAERLVRDLERQRARIDHFDDVVDGDLARHFLVGLRRGEDAARRL
mmetsp:Transcript_4280/g.13361  ORF Transcript_4280/g.13361 Transcript_4280/m.13361 type:complete len:439 (-) Transcript_4280:1048-2364(-)